MCGISGILSRTEFPAGDLLRLTAPIAHRGPDGEGYLLVSREKTVVAGGNDTPKIVWQSDQASTPDCHILDRARENFFLGLGHRRLSIIDLTAGGHQPFCDPKRQVWVVFNGEIYNYRALRQKLTELGYQFRTESDTEVLLYSYMQWGRECQSLLEGMWSFTVYDSVKKRLFFSRDRFGIKPLYYWIAPRGDLYWGSEIKQFATSPQWSARLNHQMALDYLLYSMTDHTPETLFDDVKQLQGGHYFEIDLNEFRDSYPYSPKPIRWYSLPTEKYQGSFEDARVEFKDRFLKAVESHLQADVPVGSALSGGIDSSAIVCAINRLRDQSSCRQMTFSSCSVDSDYDERKWMDPVVAETGVDAHFIYPKCEDVFRLTDKLVWFMDEPYQSQSAFLGYHVLQKAKESGVKVLLNGQGADEYTNCYGGLLSLLPMKWLRQMKFAEFSELFRKMNVSQKLTSCQRLLETLAPSSVRSFQRRLSCRKLTKSATGKNLLYKKFKAKPRHPFQFESNVWRTSFTASQFQLQVEPLPKYLRWEDRNSMAHSVEARVPFLCHHLVEFTRSLPIDYRISCEQPKRIITDSLKGLLTESVANRRDKLGFVTPEQRWFKQDHFDDFSNLLKSNLPYAQGLLDPQLSLDYLQKMQSGQIEFDFSYWRLTLFCIWMRVFEVRI